MMSAVPAAQTSSAILGGTVAMTMAQLMNTVLLATSSPLSEVAVILSLFATLTSGIASMFAIAVTTRDMRKRRRHARRRRTRTGTEP